MQSCLLNIYKKKDHTEKVEKLNNTKIYLNDQWAAYYCE